ncbi:hypothetical protein BPOR_0209g00040 [Botrytis porri]|uniref:FAD-binding PCMH-type domain-containing protein n=1 Tax=Botrytis porri TaxID=87229 RepID=A0A4Z1KQ68_9HELO|nr:hypothetical protein BPOR_0209g00040 [Botrytis porri]
MYLRLPLTSLILSTFTRSSFSQTPPSNPESHASHLQECLQARFVPYSNATSPNWANLTTPFNLRLQYTPTAVTLPKAQEQVANCVVCAARAGLKVQPRGGGHSYASYSMGGRNGSVVVDMSAGQRLGNVALGIHAQGGRALPHGTCAGVGIGGHATHGGYGYDSRLWGLALDTIVGLDVVLANGTFAHTSETENPDLWYALRGAADAFGIVTHFYMQTLAAPAEVTYFTANLSSTLSSAEKVSTAFLKTQDFVLKSGLAITGMCTFCDLAHFRDVVFPELVSGFDIDSRNITNLSWIDTLATLAAPDPLAQPLLNYDLHDTFYVKSLVTKNDRPLTPEAVLAFFSYILSHQSPSIPYFSTINLYGAPGSAIDSGEISSSSHADMDALWVFQNYGYTPNHLPLWDDRITDVIEGMTNAVVDAQPSGNFSGYVNYVDPDLGAEEAAEWYYGNGTYDRLLGIKTEVDRGFVFWSEFFSFVCLFSFLGWE